MNQPRFHLLPDNVSLGQHDTRARIASDIEASIWADPQQLSDLLGMVRGPLDFSATDTHRQQGREAMELLQRAYRAGSDHERRQLLANFGRVVYHDLIDFVEEHARELAS